MEHTTRILEFAVYGSKGDDVGIEPSESSDNNFHIEGNYPNPFSYQTTIRCQVPEGASEFTLHVYDCVGKVVDKCVYPVTRGGSQEFVWNSRTVSDGLYLYTISVTSGGKTIFSDTKKMIISKFAAE